MATEMETKRDTERSRDRDRGIENKRNYYGR